MWAQPLLHPLPNVSAPYEISYAAHTQGCTFLLDAEGICRQVVVSPNNQRREQARAASRCVGAQFVAALDPSAAGLLAEKPRVGGSMLFARVDERGRVSLVRTGHLTGFERYRADDPFESDPLPSMSVETSAPPLAKSVAPRARSGSSGSAVPKERPSRPQPKQELSTAQFLKLGDDEDDDDHDHDHFAAAKTQRRAWNPTPAPEAVAHPALRKSTMIPPPEAPGAAGREPSLAELARRTHQELARRHDSAPPPAYPPRMRSDLVPRAGGARSDHKDASSPRDARDPRGSAYAADPQNQPRRVRGR